MKREGREKGEDKEGRGIINTEKGREGKGGMDE